MTIHAVVAGPDPDGVVAGLEAAGVTVGRITDRATRSALDTAGLADATVLILTDPADATAIPVANEVAPDVTVVVYAGESIAEFARHQADLLLDPAIVPVEMLCEELFGDEPVDSH